jgi:hypothetical protein
LSRLPLTAVLTAGLVLASGCSSGDTPPVHTPTPTVAVDVWNPCDGLEAARVGKALGVEVRKRTGTPDATRCAFIPVLKGDAAITVTYQLFAGGLDAAWATMGHLDGTVSRPRVPGSDDARLVVNSRRQAVAVTGFVQNGDLIQVVNVVNPRPYDRDAAVTAGTLVMRDLSAHADDAGVA